MTDDDARGAPRDRPRGQHPTTVAVRVEAGWDRTATTAADVNRIPTAVDVPRVEHQKLTGDGRGEPSTDVRARVAAARDRQAARFAGTPLVTSGEMGPAQVSDYCRLDAAGAALMKSATAKLGLSARGCHRVLKVARTIADLADGGADPAEALQYRPALASTPRRAEPAPRTRACCYAFMDSDVLRLSQDALGQIKSLADAVRLTRKMGPAIGRTLDDTWQAARTFEPDLVLYHAKCLGSYHVAEALRIPAVLSLPLPRPRSPFRSCPRCGWAAGSIASPTG
jgi:hypothetical protein